MTPRQITDTLHSRLGGRLVALLGFIVIVIFSPARPIPHPFISGFPGILGSAVAITAAATLLRLINKRFNIMRRESSLAIAILVALEATVPGIATSLYAGSILPVIILAVTFILFSTFAFPGATREIFLAFTILSAASFITPVALYFILPLGIGLIQMRVLRLRSILAAILGIITPPWIAIGFGLSTFQSLPIPRLDLSWLTDPTVGPDSRLLAATSLAIILGVVTLCANLYRLMSYNARSRAFNGFFTILLLTTIILVVLDFYNIFTYLPLLFVLVSYEITLFFVTRPAEKNCIAILAVMAMLWGLFVWNVCDPLP